MKMKFIDLDHAGNDKLLNQLLLSLGCWLMLARRFCIHNVGLKVDAAREILTVIMTSNDENVRSCKRHRARKTRCSLLVFGDCFALSWPLDSLPRVLIARVKDTQYFVARFVFGNRFAFSWPRVSLDITV